MATILPPLRDRLSNDATYFRKVYNHTFDFARSEGQRSLGTTFNVSRGTVLIHIFLTGIETAQAFWGLLLPHGLQGGALSHIVEGGDGEDITMDSEEGWKAEYVQWWFDFLNEKGGKGVSKDTWVMVGV